MDGCHQHWILPWFIKGWLDGRLNRFLLLDYAVPVVRPTRFFSRGHSHLFCFQNSQFKPKVEELRTAPFEEETTIADEQRIQLSQRDSNVQSYWAKFANAIDRLALILYAVIFAYYFTFYL